MDKSVSVSENEKKSAVKNFKKATALRGGKKAM